MYETLKRMKDLLIVGEIYTNIRQNRAKKTVTVQKPKLLPRSWTSFPNIVTIFVSSCIDKIQSPDWALVSAQTGPRAEYQ